MQPQASHPVALLAHPMLPSTGQIVSVRARQYLVEEVIGPVEEGDATRVRLACLEDDAQGEPLEVLWELEVDAHLRGGTSWDRVAAQGFDSTEFFSAYLHALRWNTVTATDPDLFQAPYRAGIDVKAYQLEPLRKALRLPRVNLFIADDVGLGKTIEAGLILREMTLRQKLRRVVVCCPPSVLLQWQDELAERFGMSFVVMDREHVRLLRRQRGWAVNPFSTHSRFLISHALLRDEAYAAPLRDWLGDFSAGSMLILDEAHHAAPSSGARYAVDSRFTRVVRDLARRFEHRLFLSATPHNGHSNSFAALLEVLDPQRFCRGVPVQDAGELDAVMVRRLKADLRAIGQAFPERRVIQIDLDGLPEDAPELRLSAMLERYKGLRAARLERETKRVRNASALVLLSLQKRLLSSIEAFARTLRKHRKALASEVSAALADEQLGLLRQAPGADDERAELDDEALAEEEDAAVVAATVASRGAGDLAQELDLVDQMLDTAEQHRHRPDPRVRWLVDWIRREQCPKLPELGEEGLEDAGWTERRVLIFTEYADTKRYLEQQLRAAIATTHRARERIATFHGQNLSPARREAIKKAFNSEPADHPLRILICTDAAREGVNLQNHCADLFHFDVPWNPSRMEQRNGRIDRTLQRAPQVRCHYFVLPQRPEDRVLRTLVDKTTRIAAELGCLSPVLEARVDQLLAEGIPAKGERAVTACFEAAEQDPARGVVEAELEGSRARAENLRRDVERLRTLLERSRRWLGLDEQALRNAVSVALRMQRAEGLIEQPDGTWTLPDLSALAAADPSWERALDELRPPRDKAVKPRQWRAEHPPRPFVFQDPGRLDRKVVHLHLEHRLAQRLLGRFTAQGFVHHDLSRACVGVSDNPLPRVVLLGRLSLYGSGAARLHDEVIPVTARWTDPATRAEPLSPYGIRGEGTTLSLLEQVLTDGRGVPEAVKAQALESVARDVEELLPHLEARAEERAARAQRLLEERGQREGRELGVILEAQRRRIEGQLDRYEGGQMLLPGFEARELRQLDADKRHWTRRLADLTREVETEPQRIAASYDIQARRVEPVGLVYLWPVTG